MSNQDSRAQGTRAEGERQQRRRRGDEGLSAEQRLPIPPAIKAKLEAEGRVPRWVNDVGNRIHALTVGDDYDKVDGVEPVPVVVDRKSGQTAMAHLLSKPADFVREDRDRAESRRKLTEDALFRQPNAADQAGPGGNPNPATAERYLDKSTSIGRGSGNQILGE